MTTATTCADCGLAYMPSEPGDRRQHAAYHSRQIDILKRFPYYVAGYARREALKGSWRGVDDDYPARVERVILAHWSRSIDAADGAWRQHPCLARYRRAWLAGTDHVYPKDYPKAVAQLIQRYGAEPSPCLPPGCSYWRTGRVNQGRANMPW